MCSSPDVPKSNNFTPAPVEAVRSLASPFAGQKPAGMSALRIPTSQTASNPLAIPSS